MQILKHIYQVGGSLNGITWCGSYGNYEDCNTYVVAAREGLILFDCGNGETLDEIFENMEYWGLDPRDIGACFITHPHLDHAGACYKLRERGIPLYAHENTALAIESGDERCAGYLYNKSFIPCRVDERLSDGDVRRVCGLEIEAMHCPGHGMVYHHRPKVRIENALNEALIRFR
ncbi:MAG TPA: MBL fold metallo-hydrolase [Spirochaetia bacterium]|jgi:glyoxylase-like metal-dependent hydrolase (beta-lactamase superfamily II)|nr:MBL fold metallo-hydrolase [Spirochaetia bacterium]